MPQASAIQNLPLNLYRWLRPLHSARPISWINANSPKGRAIIAASSSSFPIVHGLALGEPGSQDKSASTSKNIPQNIWCARGPRRMNASTRIASCTGCRFTGSTSFCCNRPHSFGSKRTAFKYSTDSFRSKSRTSGSPRFDRRWGATQTSHAASCEGRSALPRRPRSVQPVHRPLARQRPVFPRHPLVRPGTRAEHLAGEPDPLRGRCSRPSFCLGRSNGPMTTRRRGTKSWACKLASGICAASLRTSRCATQ